MTFSNAVANYLPDSIPHKLHDEKWKLFACSFFPMTAIDVDDSGQVLRSAVLVRSPLCVHDQVALPHVLRSCVSTRNCFTLLARLRLLCVCVLIALSHFRECKIPDLVLVRLGTTNTLSLQPRPKRNGRFRGRDGNCGTTQILL